jgi:CzcA family heavy metal efflux pump
MLRSVPGVAEVSVVGGEVNQMQIKVDPEKMVRAGITLAEISKAAADATTLRGSGYLETPNQRLVIAEEASGVNEKALARTIIRGSGADAIRLGDVTEISQGAAPKFGDALIMGKEGILLAMTSQHGTNTLEVTRRVEVALESFKSTLEKEHITLHASLHRPANFIELAIGHIRDSLAIGAILVVIVLLVFLRSPRTALISFASIPISLISAMLVFHAFGITLNTMTLGGFAVAIGVVVDDAIIDVENIVRRLRLNSALPEPLPATRIILDASLEVRSAIVYATLVVIAAFIPVFLLGGVQGKFFLPLGLAFVSATLLSLVVAVTLTPALCSLFLGKVKPETEPFYLRWLKRIHTLGFRIAAKVPILTYLLVLGLGAGAIVLATRLKEEFLPEFREGHFVVQCSMIPGTSLREMNRLGTIISEELLQNPHIKSVEMQAGRSEQGVDTWGPERAELHVELKPDPSMDEAKVQDDIRTLMRKFPGIQSEVLTFLGDRIGESIDGETAAGVVSVYGPDLDSLETHAAQIGKAIEKVDGIADVIVKAAEQQPRLALRLKWDRMEQYGILPADVMTAVQIAYQGAEVSQIYDKAQVTPVVIVGPGPNSAIGELGQIPLVSATGPVLHLADVADFYPSSGHASVVHEGGRRRQIITFNTAGKGISKVMAEVQKNIAEKVPLDAGMQVTYGGSADAQAEADRNLLISSGLALVLVIMLLWIAFRSGRNVTLVLLNLPFALMGGVFALFLSGMPLSLGALVGMVALFGVSARNAIMMLSHFEHLVKSEGQSWNMETAVRGTSERLIPVLMTALVTALALVPIALKPRSAGQEIEGPMAIVILGGLISSTVLTLLVLPLLAIRFGKFEGHAIGYSADIESDPRTAA